MSSLEDRHPEPGPRAAESPAAAAARSGSRLAARLLDLGGLALALLGLGRLLAPVLPAPPPLSGATTLALAGLAPVILCLLWLPLEVGFLVTAGTTPGKWLLGLVVVTPSGGRPGPAAALRRSLCVALRGLALGFVPLALFTGLAARRRLGEGGAAPWDRSSGLRVEGHPVDARRELAAALAGVAVGVLLGLPALHSLQQPERAAQRARARSYLEEWRGSVDDWVQEAGGRVAEVGGVSVGSLGEGARATIRRRLPAGATVLVLATCDDACSALGLHARGPGGALLGDAGGDSTEPSLSFTAPEAGRYAFHLEMSSCSAPPCAFAAQVLAMAGPAAALLATEGSCFAVSPDGAVMTAAHVVENAHRISVAFPGRKEEPARVVASDADLDLALLRIQGATPDYLPLPEKSAVHMGDRVFTVGYPAATLLGASPKFAEGSVSSLHGGGESDSLLQLTVPVQPGNSGGPVVDEGGHLVGVVSAVAEADTFYQETGAYPQDVSFAVKAERGRGLAPSAAPLPPAPSRTALISRVSRATCRVLIR